MFNPAYKITSFAQSGAARTVVEVGRIAACPPPPPPPYPCTRCVQPPNVRCALNMYGSVSIVMHTVCMHWAPPVRGTRCTSNVYGSITRHVTVVMQLANPRHPRPVHISRYCPLSRSNIARYGPDFDPEYVLQKMEKSVGSVAVRVINVLLTAHAGNTVLGTYPHGCAIRACIGRYCPGAWSITHTYDRSSRGVVNSPPKSGSLFALCTHTHTHTHYYYYYYTMAII